MKKISTNKNDVSFDNKLTFTDIVNKVRAFGASIIKNGKGVLVTGLMIGAVLFSIGKTVDMGVGMFSLANYYKEIKEITEKELKNNDTIINNLYGDAILITDLTTNIEKEYYFENNNLYNINGELVSLKGVIKPIYINVCNVDEETLNNIGLSQSLSRQVSLSYTSINNECIKFLPSTVEELCMDYCNFITNLNDLPNICPNIKSLSLDCVGGLTDLSFLYNLPKLEKLYLCDSAYVTQELLDYIEEKDISANIGEKDVENSKKVDEIISNIIKPNMTETEKIQAVCIYVIDNVEYDINLTEVSNSNPLGCVLDSGKGVCASYAYFTNVLLNKAGVKSYEVTGAGHGWNILEVDDKYYYVDTTNMDDTKFYNFLLKKLNICEYYMVDTENTFQTAMVDSTDEGIRIPTSLVNEILAGRNEKDLIEKYGAAVSNIAFILASVLSGWLIMYSPLLVKKLIKRVPALYEDLEYDYYEFQLKYSERKH